MTIKCIYKYLALYCATRAEDELKARCMSHIAEDRIYSDDVSSEA